jgi:putative flippase GtrA
MTFQTVALRYAAFAVIATVVQVAARRAVLQFSDTGVYFAAAVRAGTIAGLVVKYLLDRRCIFCDAETGVKDLRRKFFVHTTMGFVTTPIFWLREIASWLIWRANLVRELNAKIGLSIGDVGKRNLDQRFLFTDRQLEAAI